MSTYDHQSENYKSPFRHDLPLTAEEVSASVFALAVIKTDSMTPEERGRFQSDLEAEYRNAHILCDTLHRDYITALSFLSPTAQKSLVAREQIKVTLLAYQEYKAAALAKGELWELLNSALQLAVLVDTFPAWFQELLSDARPDFEQIVEKHFGN